jgi:hypothetical protein
MKVYRVELFRKIPIIPPSSLAKAHNRRAFEARFAIGRPFIPEIPVCLRTLPFLNFMNNVQTLQPANDDLQFALELINQQIFFFDQERLRADSLRNSLGRYFDRTIQKYTFQTEKKVGRHPNCDGIIFLNEIIPIHDQKLPTLILEVKNEIGQGGTCPYIETAGYYSLGLRSLPEHLLKFSCAPCIGLTIAGPHLQISFFAAGESGDPTVVCGETVSPYLDLKSSALHEVAKYLKALKTCLEDLESFYIRQEYLSESLKFISKSIFPPDLVNISIKEKLFQSKLLFECTSNHSSPWILKLTEQYCIEAHQVLSHAGFAPVIHSHWTICGTPYTAIVMEYCAGQTLHEWLDTEYATPGNIQRVVSKLHEVLNLLHSQEYVHGDFRPTNIMIQFSEEDVQIKVIDFDWSGKSGETLYPFNLNKELGYLGDPGDTIDAQHDNYWVEKLLSGGM